MKALEFLRKPLMRNNVSNDTIEINEFECRKLLSRFFYINQWKWKYTISDVRVKKSKGIVIVEIQTTKPGLLIGKGGNFVSRLKSYLTNFFETDVRVKIIPNKIWALNENDS